jgi:hypothetical protein
MFISPKLNNKQLQVQLIQKNQHLRTGLIIKFCNILSPYFFSICACTWRVRIFIFILNLMYVCISNKFKKKSLIVNQMNDKQDPNNNNP